MSKQEEREQSIIPESVSAASTKKPRYGQAHGNFRTPANRRRSTATSSRISGAGLLQQKAAELQQHHHHSQTTASRHFASRARPAFANAGYADTNADGMMSQSFGDATQSIMPSQSNYFQRPGTSAGSVMQQSFGIAPRPSLSPPPPFMGRGNNGMVSTQHNNNYGYGPMGGMNGPMSSVNHWGGMSRPMSSAGGQSIASVLRANRQPPAFHFQPQNEFDSFYAQPHGMSLPPHGMTSQFDEAQCFDNQGLDPLVYDAGGYTQPFQDTSFEPPLPYYGEDHMTTVQNPVPNPPQMRNPYRPQVEPRMIANPYSQPSQQMHNPYQSQVPQEVVVQNGAGRDDASQFDDAFL